jgi:diguanylate cyclase (GGDEF)-like protein
VLPVSESADPRPDRRLLPLAATAYAALLGVWAWQAYAGIEQVNLRYALFTGVMVLYGAMSLVALRRRPENPQVTVFVAMGIAIGLTIVWPLPDFDGPMSPGFVAKLAAFSLVYTLPLAAMVHLAAMIPRPRPALTRRRWVIPGAYALAVVLAAASFIPYVNAVSPFLPWRWTLEEVLEYDRTLNHASFLAAGLASLVLLGRAARRDSTPEGRRQAAVVFIGLLPWTFRQARRIFFPLPRGVELFFNILSPVTILVFAASFFVAIAGFQLFRLGPVIRKSVAHVLSMTVLALLAYGAVVLTGLVATDAMDVHPPLWVEATVLLGMGVAFQPLSRRVGTLFERFFFPEKRQLRELQRTLIPELAALTGLDATAAHLVHTLRGRLGLRASALLVADERREFYRVRALAGAPEAEPGAARAVLTRDQLHALWRGGRRAPLVREPGAEPAELRRALDRLGARFVVPVEFRGDLTGVLLLGETATGTDFEGGDLERLEVLAQGVSAMLENARLFALATHDHLTGLAQRRVFDERLALEMERARRSWRPLAVGMADLDDFKTVNDTRGHLAGDEALRRVARALSAQARGIDVVARYGGEEFALLLPETDADGARGFGERVREALRGIAWEGPPVTVSIGFAVLGEDDAALAPDDLLRRADEALYRAKRAGKDRVHVDGEAVARA